MKRLHFLRLPVTEKDSRTDQIGIIYGFLGVLGFSLTLPATRYAVNYFGEILVGPGRAFLAAIAAGILLWIRKEKLPDKAYWISLVIVGFGAVLAFPLLTAWAMNRLPASHGAVELALLPLATAGISMIRNGERPSIYYWLASTGCTLILFFYSFHSGFGSIQPADLALIAGVLIVAVSYAEGGRLSVELGGWQVIAWALLFTLPAVIGIMVFHIPASIPHFPLMAWISWIYLGIGSQFLAFIAWYTGLGMGGIARVSQLQYLQPFFTVVFSACLLGEQLSGQTLAAAGVVVAIVAFGKRTAIRKI